MNKFSKEYIKKNFRVKKFCKHLDYILDKKKEIKTQPPLYMFILYYSLLEKVEKFSEPIKITKKSSVEDQAALKKGNKYKVVWNYEDIDKEFTNEKNDEFLQYIMRESDGGFLLEEISDNFRVVHHFPIQESHTFVYSKINKRYYHILFSGEVNKQTGFYWNLLLGSYKKKISIIDFFETIMNYCVNEIGFDTNGLEIANYFVSKNNNEINYHSLYQEDPNILKDEAEHLLISF